MNNSNQPQTNIDLFKQAKEHFTPKPIIDLAREGTTSERLKYILSVKTVTVYQMSRLCKVPVSDVIYFLFNYKHNLIIRTYLVSESYYFTTSTELEHNKKL